MGRKKSVVLMVLLTIVIVVLCALTAFPAFPIPGTVDKWNPVVLQYDLGADLGGGYYAYYYPEGVISETEYKDNLAAHLETFEDAEKEQAEKDFEKDYLTIEGSSLRFSRDEKLNIVSGDALSDEFVNAFNAASKEIAARFEKKGYSDYRVAVVDGYALRIELPKSEPSDKVSASFSMLTMTGKLTLKSGGETVTELKGKESKITDLVKSVSIADIYNTSYLKIKFTDAGKAMLNGLKGSLSNAPTNSSQDTSSLTTLDIVIGEETVAQVYKDNITDENEVRIMYVENINKDYLKTAEILLDSVLENGSFDIKFEASAIRSFEPVFGKNVLDLLYIALAIALVALLVLPVVKMGRFGGVSTYANLSYFIVTGICFAFITRGVFEITLGSVVVFLAGLTLINVLQYHIYKAIKREFDLGKTVESSVKGGYKKTLWNVVDVYVVLLLGALALLIGAAGLNTLALQALICVVTGAFINLLWARGINFVFLSASRNKFKYFRFVREDDDDE